ncbi:MULTISPECIES: carbohydrate ABC transporter permease [Providencia]|jgi:multiple sugar transport system permease protein|uniref:carbohydrate ABC transporter permease n=1 Tax=Providencia TaxID=586 RepID=UPI001C5B720C|nr:MULTISPECIES: carbohydrate ABC transporter permease [Providencia]ELR5150556.1 carbohydrate ABC transporter permease [Providencia rettgeri]QXX82299.1 carbohydrate ABC transporter permease [Providencia sp. R33]
MRAKFHTLLVWFAVLLLTLPIIWMFGTAFKSPADILASGANILPHQLSLASFEKLLEGNVPLMVWNTVLISVGATAVSVIFAFFAAYALVRYRFPAKLDNVFLLSVLIIKMMPPIVIAIPLYSLMNSVGLLNTRIGLILSYQVYTLPFCIWMLLGFIRDIPLEIEEAGAMDGAHLLRRLAYIVFPLCAPGLVATAIFSMILGWNEFLFSLLFIHTPDKFTLPLFISNFMTEDGTAWGEMMAIGIISSLPMLVLASYMQRYLLRGFSMGLK